MRKTLQLPTLPIDNDTMLFYDAGIGDVRFQSSGELCQ